MKIYSAIHLKICGFFDGDGGCAGAVSANVLPCLPSTGAWHAPVIAPKEELSSGSSAALHGGQGIPALHVHTVPRWGCLILRVELAVEHGIQLLLQPSPDVLVKIVLAVQVVKYQIDEQLIGYLYRFHSVRFLSGKFPIWELATLSATIATIATVVFVVSLSSLQPSQPSHFGLPR